MKRKGLVVKITWSREVNGGCELLRVDSVVIVEGRPTVRPRKIPKTASGVSRSWLSFQVLFQSPMNDYSSVIVI